MSFDVVSRFTNRFIVIIDPTYLRTGDCPMKQSFDEASLWLFLQDAGVVIDQAPTEVELTQLLPQKVMLVTVQLTTFYAEDVDY